MLDVVAVTRELWDYSLHAAAKNFVTKEIGSTIADARSLISFWCGLHDIGKASPGFQIKGATIWEILLQDGFSSVSKDPGHGVITSITLQELLRETAGNDLARKIATTVGGHHGVFPSSSNIKESRRLAGDIKWQKARSELFTQIAKLCDLPDEMLVAIVPSPSFFMFLAGLTSVADWIASNEDYFGYENVENSIENHFSNARGKAHRALAKLGWMGWKPATTPVQIEELFPRIIKNIRPLQAKIVEIAQTLKDHPGLVIIEAPMGEGKTEAAIYMADTWNATLGQNGYYFALPSMATSDQMFGRVKEFLENRYPTDQVNLMLLHGHAALSAEFEIQRQLANESSFTVSGIEDNKQSYDKVQPGVIASEWFTYRKRGLLSPFGVGTIDQILLAALQTKHVFVRLFGLANKTVIIDEVHAYDTYMTTLLERLLEWLAALGASVVVLSATLPQSRRNDLLKAYARGLNKTDIEVPVAVTKMPYPRISWTDKDVYSARHVDTSPQSTRILHLDWTDGELPSEYSEFCLGKLLQERLSEGGCAAVICNTVDRAQQVYMALKRYFPEIASDGQPELDILHARYLYGERKRREERTLIRFGNPDGKVKCQDGNESKIIRPQRAVLVASQVIEQSLDLDFDLIISDMAPVDLLLQRAGRMHRHERSRPSKLRKPTLCICAPEMKGQIPYFGACTEAVYDLHVLLKSWLTIKDSDSIQIPEDVEKLIENVYSEEDCPTNLTEELEEMWKKSKDKLEQDKEDEKGEAYERWIKWPGFTQEIWKISSEPREEDNPELHNKHQALTRLTGISANVLCLYGDMGQPYLDIERQQPLDILGKPDKMTTKELLMHVIHVSHRGLVNNIIDEGQQMPTAWLKEALLRHHHILFFNNENQCQFKKYTLSLNNETGLIIKKTD